MTPVAGRARPGGARDESQMIGAIQPGAFGDFLHEINEANGSVLDKTSPDWPASIAAVGLGLTACPIGVERGFVTRAEAAQRTLTTLRFFWRSKQGLSAVRRLPIRRKRRCL